MKLRIPTVAVLVWLGCSSGCNPPASAPPAPPRTATTAAPARAFSSGSAIERYFPLIDGHVYQYDYDAGPAARGVMILRVKRFDDMHGAWMLPSGGTDFEYSGGGVTTEGKHGRSHVLMLPLEVGRRWRGSNQSSVVIRRVAAEINVPAGTFRDCVETVETRGGDVPLSITVAFCADVGMVQRHIKSGQQSERLVLRSYGPPFSFGLDGLQILRDPAADGAE